MLTISSTCKIANVAYDHQENKVWQKHNSDKQISLSTCIKPAETNKYALEIRQALRLENCMQTWNSSLVQKSEGYLSEWSSV